MSAITLRVEPIDDLVQQHMPLVRAIAFQIKLKLPAHIDLEDLIQTGMLGLMDSVQKYQKQEAQFATYATQRIRGAILDELRANDHLPRNLRKMVRDIERSRSRLQQILQRVPSGQEIADEMGIDLDTYYQSVADNQGEQLSTDEILMDEGTYSFINKNENQPSDCLDRLISSRFNSSLTAAIQNLPERERYFMSLFYERDLNLKEIAEIMGVTESRASQLHSQAVVRLRGSLKEML